MKYVYILESLDRQLRVRLTSSAASSRLSSGVNVPESRCSRSPMSPTVRPSPSHSNTIQLYAI